MKTNVLLILIAVYLVLIFDLSVTFKTNNANYKFKYMGLLWVGLDYWSIKKYKSTDKPMKWIYFKKSYTKYV